MENKMREFEIGTQVFDIANGLGKVSGMYSNDELRYRITGVIENVN